MFILAIKSINNCFLKYEIIKAVVMNIKLRTRKNFLIVTITP